MLSIEEIAARESCSIRHVNMTISLAFLAPSWELKLTDDFHSGNNGLRLNSPIPLSQRTRRPRQLRR